MGLDVIMRSKTLQQSILSDLLLWIDNNQDKKLNRLGFPGEYFICELRLPDHRF